MMYSVAEISLMNSITRLTFVWFLLAGGELYVLLLCIRHRCGKMAVILNVLQLVFSSVVIILLLGIVGVILNRIPLPMALRRLAEGDYKLCLQAFAAAAVVFIGFFGLSYNQIRRFRNRHVTRNAVKEAVDRLPVGIGVAGADGEPLLLNQKMEELTRKITGELPADAVTFWSSVLGKRENPIDISARKNMASGGLSAGGESVRSAEEPVEQGADRAGTPAFGGESVRNADGLAEHGADRTGAPFSGGESLVRMDDGTVWLFQKEPMAAEIDGSRTAYEQIIATDMTRPYQITEELAALNSRLKAVQIRMRSTAAREQQLTAAREILTARTTVHNQLGNVLLTGKYYLDHPEQIREEDLLELMEFSSYFLRREAEQPDDMPDACRAAVQMAEGIGVTVTITGDLPRAEDYADPSRGARIRTLIGEAIVQCAANTVRHADGDRMEVSVEHREKMLRVTFANNGRPPAGEVHETGGLANLRREVEAAGGSMKIESTPRFLLILEF